MINPDMAPNLTLVICGAALFAAGAYLMLERSLTRILIGLLIAGNGINLLFLVASGRGGGAPLIGRTPAEEMSDPLPQAMVLTAIVITLGTAAFVLTLAYRSFQLDGNDEVPDDVEDAQIRRLARADLASQSFDEPDSSLPSEDERVIVSEEPPPEDDEPEDDEPENNEDPAKEDER